MTSKRSQPSFRMKRKKRSYDRTERVSQQIHEILALLILTELQDPRTQDVQISGVEVTQDMRQARVFFLLLNSEDEREIELAGAGLNRACGFLRRALGERMTIKHTPELSFEYDVSVKNARRIEELLEEVNNEDRPENDFESDSSDE